MVEKEKVAELMRREFAKCPVCKLDADYEISGVRKDYVQCTSCKAKWQSDDFKKGEELSKLKLHEPARNGIGTYLLHMYLPTEFWKNFNQDANIYWNVLPRPSPEISDVLVLENEEEILTLWSGDREIRTTVMEKGTSKVKKVKEYGSLILTSRRVLWVISRGVFGKSYHPIFEMRLEDIKGVSSGGFSSTYISISTAEGEHIFHLKYPGVKMYHMNSAQFNPVLQSAIRARNEEIQVIKKKERVHVLLDFSFLENYMEKGGLMMQTFRCPHCNAPSKLPKDGTETVCNHCGSTVYAQDIFEKVKELIG